MPYLDWQPRPDVRLPWQDNVDGVKWNEASALLKDLIADRAEQAVRMRWVSKAPESGLARIGDMRGWPRIPGEYVEEYRARLKLAWYLSLWRGTATGIIAALNAIGLSNVTVRGEAQELAAGTWGRNPYGLADAVRARHFWVVIDQPHPFGTDFSFRYGDGTTYGDGHNWGVTGDPRLFALIKDIVRRMRPAHSYCQDIIVILTGTIKDTGAADDGDPSSGSDRVTYLGGV
jgi:hypothetical protein